MSDRQTNVEFVTELMEFSRFGAMAQLFVMQALDEFSHAVAVAPPETFRDTAHFINPELWQGVAREITQKIDQRNSQS